MGGSMNKFSSLYSNNTSKPNSGTKSSGRAALTQSTSGQVLNEIESELKVSPEKFGATICSHVASLLNNPMFSDLTLIMSDTEKTPAHKAILSAWSTKFRKQLESGTVNELDLRFLTDPKKKAFKQFLHYLYTGTVKDIHYDEVFILLQLADEFQVDNLKNECGDILADANTSDNLNYLLDVANRFHCDQLKKRCGEFMANNFVELMDSHKIMAMEPEIWSGIVSSKMVKIKSEQALYEAVVAYAQQFDPKKRVDVLSLLLPSIIFHNIKMEYVVNKIEPNNEVMSVPGMKERLYGVFKERALGNIYTGTVRRYGNIQFTWNPEKIGSQVTLEPEKNKVKTSVAWNQAQCSQPINVGESCTFRVDAICPTTENTFGIVCGVGPDSISLSGLNSIIGYAGNEGCGYVANDGMFFPSGGPFATYGVGDFVTVTRVDDITFTWHKNDVLIHTFTYSSQKVLYPTVAMANGAVSIRDKSLA